MPNRISIVERTDEQYHRSHIIIHASGSMYHVASFDNIDQLDFFAAVLGFTYTETAQRETDRFGLYREFTTSHTIKKPCAGGFWKLEDIPEGAKPIKALSNGSIVTCYFTNDGETITLHHPNPNAKEVYKPLTLEQHIQHQRIYGCY